MSMLRLSKKRFIKYSAIFILILIVIQIFSQNLSFLSTISYATESPTLTFSDTGIDETVSGDGYKIKQSTGLITGNTLYTLTINSAGTYRIKGSCSNGNIVVKKDVADVTLIFDNLTLTCYDTAPIAVKKTENATTSATIQLIGTSTITDNENLDNESNTTTYTSDGTTYADEFEGAAIKVKSGSELYIKGAGTLNVIGTSCKNGIKGGQESSIIINSGTINIDAANNGISCDGIIEINGGTIDINAENEGIKLSPDDDDTTSIAELTINGGNINIDAGGDGIQAIGDININEWPVITINSVEDGIQTKSDFTMTNGTMNITTFGGYNASGFNSSTMSAKGIKASPSDDETDNATNMIKISAGTITLNTKDDAIHSDGYVTITGGTFDIKTGDDGVHADTSLVIGTENGLERDPYIYINYSYEGLEAGTVYIYSGKTYIIATDDGINAAGGSSNGSDSNSGGGSHFNPGGGPGGPGSNGSGSSGGTNSSSSYAIYIYGGKVFVNCDGDGLDSNGSIYLYGGTQVVYSMAGGGDNSALDFDDSIIINGATVFTAGGTGVDGTISSTGSSQKYISSTTTYSANSKVAVKNGNTVLFNDTIPKKSTYTFYSSPSLSSATISTVSSLTDTYNNAWNHNWNSGVVTTQPTSTSNGVITYTCTTCGETEKQTVLYNSSDDGTEIKIENKTGELATVSIGEETSTEDITTNITEGVLAVTCLKPCVVLLTDDNGSTYIQLSAVATETSNTYKFNFDINENLDIVVALKGDINLNGAINAADSILISRSKLSSSASAYRSLSILEEALADINNSGTVNAADAMLINRSNLSNSASAHTTLTW